MVSLEGLIRELFFRAGAWRKVLAASLMCYLLLGFGYLRLLARLCSQGAEPELPALNFDKKLLRLTFSALPLGAFYTLVPLFFAYGVENLLRLVLLDFLSPVVWGACCIVSVTLAAVALLEVPEDPERFFLGLEFEKVLSRWWKLKRAWIFPALACYGLIAALGAPFYGFTFFIASAGMVAYLSLVVRSARFV